MPAAGVVMIIAVLLIVLAVVYYLVSTIVALQRITNSLDEAITGVVGIIEKSAPVDEVVTSINTNLDAGVGLLEGLLVKKAGMEDAVGIVEGLYPGAAGEGFRDFPESKETKAPRISEVYTKGTLTLARLGTGSPDRRRQSKRSGAAEPGVRQHSRPWAVPGDQADATAGHAPLAGHRDRLARPVRPERVARSPQTDAGGGGGNDDARPGPGATRGRNREIRAGLPAPPEERRGVRRRDANSSAV